MVSVTLWEPGKEPAGGPSPLLRSTFLFVSHLWSPGQPGGRKSGKQGPVGSREVPEAREQRARCHPLPEENAPSAPSSCPSRAFGRLLHHGDEAAMGSFSWLSRLPRWELSRVRQKEVLTLANFNSNLNL